MAAPGRSCSSSGWSGSASSTADSWRAEEYIITTRRVLKVEGLLDKKSGDSSLDKINDAVLKQGIWARIFHYGDLEILTANDDAIDHYQMLAHVVDFKKAMLNAKNTLEDGYRGVAPALRSRRSGGQGLRPTTSRPRWPSWPTCATRAPSPRPSTSRRRPSCSAASSRTPDGRRACRGVRSGLAENRGPIDFRAPGPGGHLDRPVPADQRAGPRMRARIRGLEARRRHGQAVRPGQPRSVQALRPGRRDPAGRQRVAQRSPGRLGRSAFGWAKPTPVNPYNLRGRTPTRSSPPPVRSRTWFSRPSSPSASGSCGRTGRPGQHLVSNMVQLVFSRASS
jgi:hypothetical protein